MTDDVPYIVLDKKSPAEIVGDLRERYKEFDYLPMNMNSIIHIEQTLRFLSQYVTLIGFTSNGELGYLDIDMTIKGLKQRLENQNKGCRCRI